MKRKTVYLGLRADEWLKLAEKALEARNDHRDDDPVRSLYFNTKALEYIRYHDCLTMGEFGRI